MTRVLHLIDDAALGGVTRLLDSLIAELSATDRHDRVHTATRLRLPGPIDADVVVVHFTMAWAKLPFLAALRWRCRHRRVVLVEHTYTQAFEAARVTTRRRFRLMLRLAYGLVDQVVAVSAGQARWMAHAGLLPAARIRVIPCVNDLSAFAALELPRAAGPLRLGAFGRFDQQKGYDTLIEAMRHVPAHTARLFLAGYGADEAALRAAAASIDSVSVEGRVDPVAFTARMDAIVIPSRWEAGAVTCWEARAAGRPLIVTDVDGLPEQVPPTVGIVVPPDDPVRLAEAIRTLAAADRGPMTRAARHSTQGAFAGAIAAWRAVLSGARSKAPAHDGDAAAG